MPVFKQVQAGDWQTPRMRKYLLKCCDCGLVHKLQFRILKQVKGRKYRSLKRSKKYKVQFRAWRA